MTSRSTTESPSKARTSQVPQAHRRDSPRSMVGTDPIYPVEADRYHLYVSLSCPWSHRVAIARGLLGLEAVISMDVCYPSKVAHPSPHSSWEVVPKTWQFRPGGVYQTNGTRPVYSSCTLDTANGLGSVNEVYELDDYSLGSVPLLFDKRTKTVVNNESADILRMLSTVFAPLASSRIDLYPSRLSLDVDKMSAWIQKSVNNCVYEAGNATSQIAYEAACVIYFHALDRLDSILARSRYVCGDRVTEADVRLFPTVFRHDCDYYLAFGLNQASIREDYPHLWRWLGDVFSMNGVAAVSCIDQCKQSRFAARLNGTIPLGPPNFIEDLQLRSRGRGRAVSSSPLAFLCTGFAIGMLCALAVIRTHADK